MRTILACVILLGSHLAVPFPAPFLSAEEPRVNQVQVIGTHNSYHVAPLDAVMKLIALGGADRARSLDYTHRPLAEQFSRLGVRQIELDIFADPKGGLYAEPLAEKMVAVEGPKHDPAGLLQKPGMKVLHVLDVDYRTHALTLVQALQQVRGWSQQHPGHFPIMIMIEIKQSSIGPEYTQPHPFGPAELDAIDAEILSVFQATEIIKPDDVRGDFISLRRAVATRGWPKLADARGKVMFAMDNGGDVRDAYLDGHPSLGQRLLFVSVDENHPAAAFMKINDPVRDFDRIQRMVKAGFLVRTRADSGTIQSRENDTTQRDKALASGAHFVSTDYPEPDARFSDYQVRFDNGVVARANPVTGQPEWKQKDFDQADTRGSPP